MVRGDLLRHVIAVLERRNIRYFVTGSTATMYFGDPRLTNDIDIVVDLSDAQLGVLIAEFPSPDFYLSEDAMRIGRPAPQPVQHHSPGDRAKSGHDCGGGHAV